METEILEGSDERLTYFGAARLLLLAAAVRCEMLEKEGALGYASGEDQGGISIALASVAEVLATASDSDVCVVLHQRGQFEDGSEEDASEGFHSHTWSVIRVDAGFDRIGLEQVALCSEADDDSAVPSWLLETQDAIPLEMDRIRIKAKDASPAELESV